MMAGFGIQRLLDSHQNLMASGARTFLVLENYDVDDPALSAIAEMGLTYVPSVSGSVVPGVTDIEILPPPDSAELSISYVRDSVQAGVALRSGARRFTISDTWVEAQRIAKGFATPSQVFTDRQVRGIRFGGVLFNIQRAVPNAGLGNILSWDVFCNGPLPATP